MKTGPKNKITIEKFKEALPNTGGLYALIAEKLGCGRTTVYSFLKEHPKLESDVQSERDRMLDLAEGNLIDKAINKKDFKAIKYFLSTKGKDRGYSMKHEMEHSGKTGLEINFNIVRNDFKKDAERNT